jgi:hypothetical protein
VDAVVKDNEELKKSLATSTPEDSEDEPRAPLYVVSKCSGLLF